MAIDWTAVTKKAKQQDAAYNAKATQGAQNRAAYQAIAKDRAVAQQVATRNPSAYYTTPTSILGQMQSGATSSLPSIPFPSATSSTKLPIGNSINRDKFDESVRNHYVQHEMSDTGNKINSMINGNIDYNKRKYITGRDMKNAGWTRPEDKDLSDDDNVTTYTIGYYGDDFDTSNPKNKEKYIELSPIRNDGTVMSPQETERYAQQLLASSDMKAADRSANGTLFNTWDNPTDAELDQFESKYAVLKQKQSDIHNRQQEYKKENAVASASKAAPAQKTANYINAFQNQKESGFERAQDIISSGASTLFGGAANAVQMATTGKYSPTGIISRGIDKINGTNYTAQNAANQKSFANKMMDNSLLYSQNAKRGLGKIGQAGVDIGSAATQIGLMALTGGVAGSLGAGSEATGALTKGLMSIQQAGQGAYDAEKAGAGEGTQALYGLLQGATAYVTEGISNVGALGKVFGNGAADSKLEQASANAISKFIKSDAGRSVANRLATGAEAGLGEAFEQNIQDALTPIYQRLTYDKNAKLNAEDMIYNGLVAGAVGGIVGGAGKSNLKALETENDTRAAESRAAAEDAAKATPVANTTPNLSQVAPNLIKPSQNIAQEAAKAPTVNESAKEVKLPAETENALTEPQRAPETKADAYQQSVNEQESNIKTLEDKAEYERAIYRNLYAEYRSTDVETRRPELIAESATQNAKVEAAENAVTKAQNELQAFKDAHTNEIQSKTNVEKTVGILSDLNGRFINENTLKEIEQIGALPKETAELRKAFDRATRLQKKANELYVELTNAASLKESVETQAKLDKVNAQLDTAAQTLKSAQDKIANYSKSVETETSAPKAKTSIFPENSLGAKITTQKSNIPLKDSKNSVVETVEAKPKRFSINDDTNVDLDKLPEMSNKVVMTPRKKKGTLKTNLDNVYTHIVNILHPVDEFSKETGDRTAMLAQNSVNAGGTVSHIIGKDEKGALVDMDGNVIGKSLKDVAKDIPKGQETDFWNYMMQRRNIDKALEDKNVIANYKSSMSKQYVEKVEAAHPEWKKTGDNIVKWLNDFNQAWGVDSGLISQEAFDQMKLKDPNYVPAQREFSEVESALTGGEIGRKFVDNRSPIKKMEGSERDINNPLENIMRLVDTTVKAARYNEVGQSMLNTLRENPRSTTKAEIISEEQAKNSAGNNIVTVIENGQKQYIKINDVSLLESLKGLPKSTYTIRGLSDFSTGFKKLTTQENPLFGIVNFVKDVPTGYVYGSQSNPFKYLAGEVRAFKELATNGEMAQRYKAVGGGSSSFFSSADAETAALNLTKTQNVFQKVGMSVNKFNAMIEEATRLNEFSAVFAKTGDVQKALAASNDVTVNFARGGDVIKTVDRNGVPYLNASIQGLDKLGKAFMPDKIAKTLFTGAVGITLPTMILYLSNRDNPYYNELSNRTKDDYFCIPNKFGELDDSGKPMTFIKIPKSREVGMVFGALAERIARAVDGDEEAFKGFGNAFATNIAPANPLDSGVVGPLIGLKSNKDFAGRTIVPQNMQERSGHLQFDEKTSELTKFIAAQAAKAGVELSPKQMDYLIDSWTGVVGDFLLPATTKGANALSPITNKFTADPRYSSQVITNFYDKMDEAAKKANDKNFSERLDPKTVTLEEKVSSNYAKASKEMSALSKVSARAGVGTLTDEDKKLLSGYGIDATKNAQDIQKDIRTKQNTIAKEATARGTRADEMELDLNNSSKIAKKVEKYQSAGFTQRQAYTIYNDYNKAISKVSEDSDPTQLEITKAIESMNLLPAQKGKLWQVENYKSGPEKNPYTGTLAQKGLSPSKSIEIMEAFDTIDDAIGKNYVKADKGPSAAQVKAAYLIRWLSRQGYNANQRAEITEVFTTWQMIAIDKPSKKATQFVSANPMP